MFASIDTVLKNRNLSRRTVRPGWRTRPAPAGIRALLFRLLIGLATTDTFVLTVNAAECAIAIGAGSTMIDTVEGHAGAVLKDGSVWMWGYNKYGQLGNGTTNTTANPIPIQVGGINNATAMAAGLSHTVVLLSDGTLKAWGRNQYGQLGNGTSTNSTTPVTVSGISNAIAVAAGDYHSTALLADGSVKSWGWNFYGQLGNGTTTANSPNPTPVAASGITTATKISARFRQTLVILADKSIMGWGNNHGGELGNGNTLISEPNPVTVSGINTAVAISAADHSTAAILADGTMRSWGKNIEGALGTGVDADSPTPVQVTNITTAMAVSSGDLHYLVILSNGTVRAWGKNTSGQLGNNSTAKSNIPVPVDGIATATAIRGAGLGSHALLADGTIKSWGENNFGQLGDNNATNDAKIPVSVSNINPCPPDDAFSIVGSIQGTAVLLTWPSVPGQTFRVEHRPTLDSATAWSSLVTNWPAAAGAFTTYVQTNALTAPTGFYRVLRLP